MLDPKLQLEARHRPKGSPIMLQQWRHLLFLHASFEPEVIQETLPPGLTVDTFPDAHGREMAWIGLVPFTMQGIRLRGLPALPWLSSFHETNVRTYVHHNGGAPGVWFYSLDAARWLACIAARLSFGLPYFHARMCLEVDRVIRYRSERKAKRAELDLSYKLGSPISPPQPGSLEFFLVERYRLYSMLRGNLFEGLVHHAPYSLKSATLESCQESLLAASELPTPEFSSFLYSSGVDVEIFSPRRVSMG